MAWSVRYPTALLVALLSASSLVAAESRTIGRVRIASPAEVVARRHEIDVVDARPRARFRDGHLPDAQNLEWRSTSVARPNLLGALAGEASRWGLVRDDASEVGDLLSGLGLSNEWPIVVVGDGGGWGDEGRVAWSLLYWGASEVWLLDGGFAAWKEFGLAVETGAAGRVRPTAFHAVLRDARRIRSADLARRLADGASGLTLLDARSAKEFAGERVSGQKRGGRLPDAHLVPAESLYRANGRYVTAAELTALVGGPLADEVVTYCTGGVRSALLALLVEARLGRVARNYDGSLWEWAADPALPLVAAPGS